METSWFERTGHGVHLALLFIMSYFLLMFGNGIVSLTHPDEVFYVQSAKEMLDHNSWLTPMLFDDVQFEKPFLSFALFMVAIKWFGVTSFAGRFFPALFGMIGVGVVYWISWILFKKKRVSFITSVVLSSSFIYIALSRAVLTDMIFSVFVSIAIAFFCLAYHNRKYKNRGMTLFFVFAGIAVLTKGALGILFPLTIVLIFLAYKKEMSFLKCRSTLWGVGLFLVIAVPWHVLMYHRYGQFFIEEYFYNVHWRRVLAAEHARLDNWYFYIVLMCAGIVPWFLFWIPAVRLLYRQFVMKLADRDRMFFLLSWIAGVYVCVQPAHSKLASYLFPAFPAIAMLLGYTINDLLERIKEIHNDRTMRFCGHGMTVFLTIIAVGGLLAGTHYINILVDLAPVYYCSVMLLCVALLILLFNHKKLYTQMILTFVGFTAVVLATIFYLRPYIEPWVSCKEISDAFNKIDRSDTPILSSKFYVRGVRYYTGRPMAVIDINGKGFWSPHPIPYLNEDHELLQFVNSQPVTWAILKKGSVEDVHRILHGGNFKITDVGRKGGKFILKIEKTGQI